MLTALILALSTEISTIAPDRGGAAEALSSGIARAAEVEGAARMAVLRASATIAVDSLADGRSGLLVDRAVHRARWRAMTDVDAAADELLEELRDLASDLTFEPLIEAPLPEGWPGLTPVHEIELLSYPRYRMATSPMDGGNNSAFWRLFQHIDRNAIAMTAPVEMTLGDEPGAREVEMAFLYQSPEQTGEVTQSAVAIVDAEPALAVSIGLRGSDRDQRVAAARGELEAWLANHPEYELDGAPRVLGYNSPMVPRSRRYFEVQLPVRRVAAMPANAY